MPPPACGDRRGVQRAAVGPANWHRSLQAEALEQLIKRDGRQAGVERLHPHPLRHTFACRYLMRYRDPFALKSLLGHTTPQMTNHYYEAVRQLDGVRADTTSIVDSIDTKLLDINRRGRPKQRKVQRNRLARMRVSCCSASVGLRVSMRATLRALRVVF